MRIPARSSPASGSSTHSTPNARSRSITRRASAGPSAREMSPGIRHHWLRSTMISSRSPTACAHGRHHGHPEIDPLARDPDLDRAEPVSHERQRIVGPPSRVTQRPPRRVGGQPIGRAPEQRRDRNPASLPEQVPQRRLQRPVAPGMERDRLERPCMPGNGERVPAHEQLSKIIKAVHRVAAPDSDEAGVGLDPHERGLERAAWLRIPGGEERGIERRHEPLSSGSR